MKYWENTAFVALSRYPIFTFLIFILLCPGLPAYVDPFLTTLDGLHPSRDIRQLNLSVDQHAALRRLCIDLRQINNKVYCKTVRSDCNHRQTIIKILFGDSFDSNAVCDHVESRYLSSMDYAVNEIEIQYRLYHLLNLRQRQQ